MSGPRRRKFVGPNVSRVTWHGGRGRQRSRWALLIALEVDLLAGLRLVPLLVVVLVEEQALVGGGADPGTRFHFGLELAGRPAGIAQHEPQAARPPARAHG